VGEIPEDWKCSSLGEIIKLQGGYSFNSKTFTKGGVPVIRISDIKKGIINLNDSVYVSEGNVSDDFVVSYNDILIAMSGATTGKTGVYKNKTKAYQNQRVGRFEVKDKEKTLQSFLRQLVKSTMFQKKLSVLLEQGAQPNISGTQIESLVFGYPKTKKEQNLIANVLSDTDSLITSLEKQIAKKKLIKKGTMQELLTGKKRLPEFDSGQGYKETEVGMIPEDWRLSSLATLTKLFTKQTGFDYSAYIKPSLIKLKKKNHIPFIQNKDFKNKWINLITDFYIPLEVARNFPKILLDEKSLLISISGSIGNVGVYELEKLAFIGGAIAILKFNDARVIDWVMYYLNSIQGQNQLVGNVKSGSHKNLILEDIRKIQIPLPTLKEQTAIANALFDMDSEIEALEKKLEKYKKIKEGMMQKLLTGKIRLI
jgi:type I restriction enzyme S subunit